MNPEHTPATDEEVTAYEKALLDQDIHTAYGDIILKLIARIHAQEGTAQ